MGEIRQVDSDGKIVEPAATTSEPKDTPITTGGTPVELLEPIVHRIMGLEDADKLDYRDKVQILIDFAKQQTDDHSPENIGWVLRDFDMRLGSGPFAEKRINYVANYAKLKMHRASIDEEIKKINKNAM